MKTTYVAVLIHFYRDQMVVDQEVVFGYSKEEILSISKIMLRRALRSEVNDDRYDDEAYVDRFDLENWEVCDRHIEVSCKIYESSKINTKGAK